MRIPHSSFIVKSIGPSIRSRPRSRSQPVAASIRAPNDLRVVLGVEEAEHPVVAALVLVPAVVDVGGDPADDLAVALGEQHLALGVLEPGVLVAIEELAALEAQRRHPLRVVAPEAVGNLDEGLEVALARRPAGWTRPPRG